MLPISPEPAAELTSNPYRAPESEIPGEVCGSSAEALRLSHARTEGNLKGLGIYLLLLGIAWVVQTQYNLSIVYLHVKGVVSAPWVAQPFSVVRMALMPVLAIAATTTGYGLLRRRAWSMRMATLLVLVYVAYWLMLSGHALWSESVRDAAAVFAIGPIWMIPMMILRRADAGTVLSSEYAAAIKDTPYFKVRPRIPFLILLAMLLDIALVVGVAVVLGLPKS